MAHSRLITLVVGVALAAAISLVAAWDVHQQFPGFWALGSFLLVAFLLDETSNPLRVGAVGSTSFVIHLTAGILFGGFWGGVVAGVSTAVNQITRGQAPMKLVYNVAQRTLCVAGASLVYQALGGSIPPAFLTSADSVPVQLIQRDLGLFFVFAGTYFVINTVAVNLAIAISTGRRFGEVWNLNVRGVLGYDLGASAIALLVAWLYTESEARFGFGPWGLVGIAPVIIVRHIYGMYRRLQESGLELLEVMVKAMEARDPYTSGHSIRVSSLSRAIAVDAGLPAKEIEEITTAGLLHDVGKIHEEFAPLLRKEAKLTEEEFALLQTHSAKGAELVGIISSFRGSIQGMVRNHHERWDGNGYPDGLSGEDIPLGSRIIMISDTIDAMTTDRPYRKALSVDVVLSELQRCKGTQFDHDLIDVTLSSLAVRRLIAEHSGQPTPAQPLMERTPGRSKRVGWASGKFWRVGLG